LIDIPFTQLALNALGKPVDVVPTRLVRLLFLVFNHALCGIRDRPLEELGFEKIAILPSMLFIDPGKNSSTHPCR